MYVCMCVRERESETVAPTFQNVQWHAADEAWRGALWLYFSREVLTSIGQFRACVHLFCLRSKDVSEIASARVRA